MRVWWRQTIGGLPKSYWYLWTGTLVNRLGSFVILFLAIYLTRARGFSTSYAGLVVGLFGAGSACGTLLGGILADRWGRRRTLALAYLSGASFMIGWAWPGTGSPSRSARWSSAWPPTWPGRRSPRC